MSSNTTARLRMTAARVDMANSLSVAAGGRARPRRLFPQGTAFQICFHAVGAACASA